ncbi:MAG TPA: MBL fold metallo-hydrolase [Longimicrobiaceae bacterium]|nr:MBL fold metallo-hydrolase [Longimicrobiaceae bacterium]
MKLLRAGLQVVVWISLCARTGFAGDPAGSPLAVRPDTTSPLTRVILLGTGTPNADPDRAGPSVAVVVNGTAYLVDSGPGVVRRAAAAQRKGIAALEAKNLKHVFITHLHSDHTLGYPDLILSPWVLEREEPLRVYGPEGIRHMTEHLLEAYREDIAMRIYGLEPGNHSGYKVDVHEIRPGLVYEDHNVRVYAFPVRHGSWPNAYGFRFVTPDRTVVISGDAAPSESVVEACAGCDLLIHEVYSVERFSGRPPEWQRYHSSFHTSTRELAEIATRARPRTLVLYHQLFWGATNEDLEREIRQHYNGRVVSGNDLDIF